MKLEVDDLILKINKSAIKTVEQILERNKISIEKDTFQYISKIIDNINKNKYYLPFISTFFICLLRKKAPKHNTITISGLFLIMEYFMELEDNKKLSKNINHFIDISNVIILEELMINADNKVELLKKIKNIARALTKSEENIEDNLDRIVKLKIADNLQQIIQMIDIIYPLTNDEKGKLKIYFNNLARLIYFNKKNEKISLLEFQKLSMMKSQADKMLTKFETTGRDMLINFSNLLLKHIEYKCENSSIAV